MRTVSDFYWNCDKRFDKLPEVYPTLLDVESHHLQRNELEVKFLIGVKFRCVGTHSVGLCVADSESVS